MKRRRKRSTFLSPVVGKVVHVAFAGSRLTSNVDVLVLARSKRQLAIVEHLACCIDDARPLVLMYSMPWAR